MITKIIQTKEDIKEWAIKNPKKIYLFSFLFIIVCFITNITISLTTESPKNDFLTASLISDGFEKSNKEKERIEEKEKQREIIVNELKELKIKRDNGLLNHSDSLRIDFLYDKYQNLR